MNIEKRIRAIAAKKVKVIITGKVRNRDGFTLTGPANLGYVPVHGRTKKELSAALLARIRCMDELVWKIEPVKITPNPKHKADVSWKRRVL